MDVITPGFLIVVVIAVIVVGAVFGGRRLRAKPPSRIYRCRSCGSAAHHNARTLEAWRRGKTAFFCQSCHRQWLRSQPPGQRDRESSTTGGGSGCLGGIALVAALPLGLLWAWLLA